MSIKIVSILGTRPELNQLVKEWNSEIEHSIIWTGQHYDKSLKDNLFEEFKIHPLYILSNTSLGKMIEDIYDILKADKPDYIIVYGDTRSAMTGALVANELDIPIIHSEAGIRSYDKTRPEERYRIMIDHIAELKLCSVKTAIDKLKAEGITDNVVFVGDPVYDEFLERNAERKKDLVLLTTHRREHINNRSFLEGLIHSLKKYNKVLFPIHPHTKKKIEEFGIVIPENVEVVEPLSFQHMTNVLKQAKIVITDSGGLQKEAYWAGCQVIVLGNSEWKELEYFGNGNAKQNIVIAIMQHHANKKMNKFFKGLI